MHQDILPSISRLLTPDVIGRIASLLGRDSTAIQKAIGAAVPGILSGLANLTSTPEGARRLESTITWQVDQFNDPGMDLTRGLESGKGALSALFGYSGFNELAGAVSRFSGIGIGSSRSVLGMIAPAVLGTLGRAQREAGLGPAGLAQMLSSQMEEISAAMPRGFSELLETSGFFDGIDAAAAVASKAAEQPYANVHGGYGPTLHAMSTASPPQRHSFSWLYWALPILALAVLAWYLLPSVEQTAQVDEPGVIATKPSPVTRVAGSVARDVASAADSLRSSLLEISDSTSAELAIADLEQAIKDLERATAALERLPADGQRTATNLAKDSVMKLKAALDSTAATPGVASVLHPTLSTVRPRLDALAAVVPSPAASDPMLARQIFLPSVATGSIAVSSFYVREVYNGMGEKLGTVKDLVVEPTGQVTAVIIGVGDFLGIGEKEIAVPFSVMTIVRRNDSWHVVVDASRDTLHEAPAFAHSFERVHLSPTQ